MTEYFTKEKTQLEKEIAAELFIEGEPVASTSTSAKRQRREDVVRFGDLSLEELMDEDEGSNVRADGSLEANEEGFEGLPDLEVVESDDDDEGRPPMISESEDERPRSRNNTANNWRQEMRFLDEMRRSISRNARENRRREKKEELGLRIREIQRALEEAKQKKPSQDEWNDLEKRATELVEDTEKLSSAGEGSSGEEVRRPVLRLRGGGSGDEEMRDEGEEDEGDEDIIWELRQ